MPSITIRPYQTQDWKPIVRLWNRSVSKDPLTEERFWRLFLLDPNFDVAGLLIAESRGELVGMMQVMTRKVEAMYVGLQADQAWLTAFCVCPNWRRKGIARRLWEAHEQALKAKEVRNILCNGYAPYYLFPGVDQEYVEAHSFLRSVGFEIHTDAVAMGMEIEGVPTPKAIQERRSQLEREGIEVRLFRHEDTLPLLNFTATHFPYWQDSLLDGLRQGNLEIMVALQNGEPIGLTQWQNTYTDPPHGLAGRFGPFGVRDDMRSKGIGAVIFYSMVERAKAQGSRYLWFGWAGGRNVSFYERMGCHVARKYVLYRKGLL